ncbi:hypothetical protein VNO80_22110 [Phaseolus coccineus]|uniref:Uncharacterized protein n=1 Tax=Phaseolus coccineus TaxID=3886 RepID=A0AAN9M3I6_PHACN
MPNYLFIHSFFSSASLCGHRSNLSISQQEEAVKMTWECGPDASVVVKHRPPVARQCYRFCDLIAAISGGGGVFRLPNHRCDRSEPP